MKKNSPVKKKPINILFLIVILVFGFIITFPCFGQEEYFYKSTGTLQTSWEAGTFVLQWAADVNGDGFLDVIVTGGVFPPTPERPIEMKLLINDGFGLFNDQTNEIISSKGC